MGSDPAARPDQCRCRTPAPDLQDCRPQGEGRCRPLGGIGVFAVPKRFFRTLEVLKPGTPAASTNPPLAAGNDSQYGNVPAPWPRPGRPFQAFLLSAIHASLARVIPVGVRT